MDEQQKDSEPPIQALLKWVESTLDRGVRGSADVTDGYDWDVPYVSQAALRVFLNKYQAVDKLLNALFGDHPSKDYLNARQIKENYCRIFCLLITIGKGPFIIQFVENGIDDQCLPLQTKPPDFPSSASDPQFFPTFYQKQWQFCVPKLHADIFNRQYKAREYILPIRRIGELGEGVSAVAFKVEVPDCYNGFAKDMNDENRIAGNNGNRPAVKTYVLKSYRTTSTAEKHYENEWRAYKKIHSNQACPNILGVYSGFRLGVRNNLLLEHADQGTLEDYLEKTNSPSSAEDIIDLWESILRVINRLIRIHNPPSSDAADQQVLRGWHQDIKPTNILIKSGPYGSVYKFDCKLADLGISHFKRRLPFENNCEDITDTDAFGTRVYGAPECFRLGAAIERFPLNVKQDVDIWSLGCVLSEVATWAACNWKMVLQYRNQRQDETKRTGRFGNGDCCFHDGRDGVLKCVDTNHDELVARHVKAHDHVTKRVVKLVKDDMLRPSSNTGRRSAAWLYGEVDTILKVAKGDLLKLTSALRTSVVLPEGNEWHPSSLTLNTPGQPLQSALLSSGPPLQPSYHPVETGSKTCSQKYPSNREFSSRDSAVIQRDHAQAISGTEHPIEGSGENLDTVKFLQSGASALPQHPRTGILNVTPNTTPDQLSTSFVDPSERGYIHEKSLTAYTSRPLAWNSPALGVSSSVSDECHTTPMHPTDVEDQTPRYFTDPNQSVHQSPLQSLNPPPVWPLGQALRWRRATKDPKNHESIHMPKQHRLDGLGERDHAFLIENVSSMLTYWTEARELLDLLGKLVKNSDPDGVDIYFTIPFKKYLKVKKTTHLLDIFDKHRPKGGHDNSDMSARLSDTVSDYQRHLTWKYSNLPFKSRNTRPLSLYVFSDAVWQPVCNVAPVIKSLVNTLSQQNLHKQQVGIQFIQFGNEPKYTNRLQDLDRLRLDGHVDMDIVDTEPSTGNVWKMLFGAINDWFDDDDPRSSTVPASPVAPVPSSREGFSIPNQISGNRFSHALQHSPG